MEELSLGPNMTGDVAVNVNMMEETVVIGDQLLPFLDGDSNSVVFKGVIDPNGALYLDPAQFAAYVNQAGSSSQAAGMTITMIPMNQVMNSDQSSQENQRLTHTTPVTTSSSHHTFNIHQRAIQNMSPLSTTNTNSTIPISNSSNDDGAQLPFNISFVTDSTMQPPPPLLTPSRDEIMRDHVMEPPIGKGPFRCPVCNKEFSKWPQLRRHKAEHLDEKLYRCRNCPMTFNFEANLKVHGLLHEAEASGILQCQICPAKFSRLASLKSHLRVHEKEENLVCQECGDEFFSKARLETHLVEHRTRTQQCMVYRCRLCGKTFTQSALLKDHSKEHAAIRSQLKVLSSRRRKGKPKSHSVPSDHTNQLSQRLDKKKRRVCDVCGKRFEKPSQLTRHLRIHTGEKPYACEQCGKKFNQKGTLESHVQAMHEKVKPFECYLCSCRFSQRGNLKAHVLKVHVPPAENEKVFRCVECSCVYRRLATLNNHIAKAHTKTSSEASLNFTSGTIPVSNTSSETSTQTVIMSHNESTTGTVSQQEMLTSTLSSHGNTVPISSSISGNVHGNQSAVTNSERGNIGSSDISGHHVNLSEQSTLVEQSSQQSLEQDSITEVKLAHDEQGKSRRCLVKVRKIGQVKWHLCPFCSKAFRKPSDLIRHIRVHTQEKPYACNICPKSFAVKSTLNTHIRTHCPSKDLECRVCHKRFSMLSSLKSHERLHTGVKPFQCMQCGKAFRTSSQRRIHCKIHSRNALGLSGKRKLLRIGDSSPQIDLPDPLKITSEGLVPVPNRSTQALILKGSPVEGKTRPYKCKECPAAFKKSSHLKQHVRTHTGERPYKCFQCYRSFVSSGVLKNHIKTHEGVRAFKCNVCNISFTTNGSLTRHMATHTSLRPFVCPYCHKTFKTTVACRKHIKTHRNEVVAFHSVSNNQEGFKGVNGGANDSFTDDYGQNDNHFDEGLSGAVASALNGDMGPPNVTLVQNDSGIGGVSGSMISVESNDDIDCITNLHQQSFQELNNLMSASGHAISTSNGQVNLQYTLSNSQVSNTGHHQHLSVESSNQSVFDHPVFSLKGESLDLHAPLASFLSQAEGSLGESICNVEVSSSHNQIASFEYPITESVDETNLEHQNCETVNANQNHELISGDIHASSLVQPDGNCHVQNPSGGGGESEEVQRIRESSRPISERIYNELRAQEQHNKVPDPMSSERLIQKVNECHFCMRAFKKRSDLQRHVRIHTGEKPFRCQVCGKAFRVKSTREAHMRTHEGGKTVSCHVCNNLFSTKSSLRVHMRLHTGAKPYQCPHCDRWFRTSGHRKAHVQSHFKSLKEANNGNSGVLTQTIYLSDPGQSNNNCQLLPPVQTIKGESSLTASTQDELDISAAFAAVAGEGGISVGQGSTTDPVHVIGSLQLTLEGPTIQITGLDLNSLQMDDSFLQNLGNVIFMTPNQLGVTQSDLNAVNGVVGVSMPGDVNVNMNQHESCLTQSQVSSVLTGKDVNVGDLSQLSLIRNSTTSNNSVLSGASLSLQEISGLTLPSMTDHISSHNNVSITIGSDSYVVSELVERLESSAHSSDSTPVPSAHHKDKNSGVEIISNKVCTVCGKQFSKPSLLTRHMRIHTGERPFKCTVCKETFSQRGCLDTHLYTHSDSINRPFVCDLCPFRTVQKSALRKHWSRAHSKIAWNKDHTHRAQVSETPQHHSDNVVAAEATQL